ncbi:MAG: hypothetical protein KDD32_03650, partial [Bacteroidetes bacterium]|nr:hypothetical protein [Bacteroidota bacterium]
PTVRRMSDRDDIYGRHKDGHLISVDIGLNHFDKDGERFSIAVISDISHARKTNKFLRGLHSIISNAEKSTSEKIELILHLGCEKFELPIGILSKIDGNDYAIVQIVADDDQKKEILAQQSCKVDHTYCHDVILADDPIYIDDTSKKKEHPHPCYWNKKLEIYIGAKVLVDDQLYGTINFSSSTSSKTSITNTDLEILKLIAQWIGYMLRQESLINKLHQFNLELESKVASRTQELKHALSEIQDINSSLKVEIDRRKEAEESAKASLEKEKELNVLKSRFVSTASHEFRTPLTGILSSVTLIDKYASPEYEEKRNKHINIIKTSVKNLTSILNDFLSLSKLESGKVNYEPQNFNLEELLKEIIEEMNVILKTGQQIKYTMIDQGDGIIHQDPKLLKNVIINLLSNASKYSDEGKLIEVKITFQKQHVLIEVTDQGIGIPSNDQSHLFDRFFRASNVTAYQGTGLGLNISKKNIEIMGGTIDYKSVEHKGTTMMVSLPINHNA